MDQEHPIPQQISAYQFRLVGDMTLKQFFQIAGGALVALLFYSSGLHPVIKWPLIIISFSGGVALAFLPLQDRPLEKWIVLFFKAVYSPTIFIWQKKDQAQAFFQGETIAQAAPQAKVEEKALPQIQPSAPAPEEEVSKPPPVLTKPPKGFVVYEEETPVLEEKELVAPPARRKVKIPESAIPTPDVSAEPLPEGEALPAAASSLPEPMVSVLSQLEEKEKSFLSKVGDLFKITPAAAPKETPVRPKGERLRVPEVARTTVEPKEKKETISSEQLPVKAPVSETEAETRPVAPPFGTTGAISGQAAQFSPQAAPPTPPTQPNTVVGQVLDPNGKIVEGAILEIKDSSGRPVRALKTNKLGHFIIVTSLVDGKYEIITEKEGFIFEPVVFEAKGEIIPPISIWAKGKAQNGEEKS